jgi:hypothetical protein
MLWIDPDTVPDGSINSILTDINEKQEDCRVVHFEKAPKFRALI